LYNGFYPSTDQGLQALIYKPTTQPEPINWKQDGYLSRLPIDPWGKPYQYLNPGMHNIDSVDIFAYGPNSTKQKMIGNWE
jgi:general secretion pathway protein G